MTRPSPLALPRAEFERLGRRVVELVAEQLDGIRERPVHRPLPLDLRRRLLRLALPEDGIAPDRILDFLAAEVVPWPMGSAHPRFFAWVNSPPAPIGVLTDALASSLNSAADGAEHAGRFMLKTVTRWLAELIGYPAEDSMGLLVSGGSMANLTALAVARHWAAERDGWNVRAEGLQGGRPPLVVYASDEAHSCIRKSVELLGLGTDNLRLIPSDDQFRLPLAPLAEAIAADRAAGRRPFCVVASAGTVNTGAVDPMGPLADLAGREGLWLHVDGAYGAFGRVDPAAAPLYAGLERAGSVALDPHKWLSVPIECGAVLVRDAELQRRTFSLVPAYLDGAGAPDPDNPRWTMEYGFTLTAQVRAIKTYAVLAALGRGGVRAMIARHNALAKDLAARIDAAQDLERLAPVSLSAVCFRYVPPGRAADGADLDGLQTRIAEAINREGEAFIMTTRLRGRTALRACVLHYDNDEGDMAHLVDRTRHWGRALNA
jgi:glutamate/tyrosine decarboxylase-like PLP-dependent enzyme